MPPGLLKSTEARNGHLSDSNLQAKDISQVRQTGSHQSGNWPSEHSPRRMTPGSRAGWAVGRACVSCPPSCHQPSVLAKLPLKNPPGMHSKKLNH
jgi:hypothetical protein